MTIPETSPLFATVGTYPIDGDSWEGDPVRVDPGASRRAEGWEPDTLPAEWANFMTGVQGDWIEMLRRRRLATSLGTWTERASASPGSSIRAIASQPAPVTVTPLGSSFPLVPPLPVDHFLAVSVQVGSDKVQASSDGSIWTDSSTGLTANDIFDLGYLASGNRWIAVCGGGSGGSIYSRVAGNLATAWSLVHGPSGGQYTAIACSPSRAIAIGLSNRCATSTDGVTWTNLATLPVAVTDPGDIEYGGGIFVVVYRDTIITSTDGSVWTTRHAIPVISDFAASRVAYDATRNRFFVTSSTNGHTRILSFLASDPDTFFPSVSLAEAVTDISCCNGVLALVSENHARFSDDAGASFSYAYTGPTEITGSRVCSSPVLSCFFVVGDDGAGSTYLTQSLRGL